MEKTRPLALRPPARWWSRLLDGQRVWGSVDLWPARYGCEKYRLVLFPPGISHVDRRLVRLWRGWPMWGVPLWVMSEIVLYKALSPDAAIVGSMAVYLAAGAIAFTLAGRARAQVRTLHVVLIIGRVDAHAAARYAEWQQLVGILTEADDLVTEGKASIVEHEAVWWQAYDRLGAVAA